MSTRPRRPAPATPAPGKLALPELAVMKHARRPITMLTAYDYPSAQVASTAGVDVILVGDSAAMTVLGHDSTVPVTIEEMLLLTRAVARGSTHPLVVADMPFLSYQPDDRDAILNAGRLVKEGGADAIKVEGAAATLPRIRAITGAGIPVMGHLGLTPQSATALGGFKAQGRTAKAALRLLADAAAVQDAGAFALVLECVPHAVAAEVTRRLEIPTIGIGAGAGCDGQVLVYHDLLGLGASRPPRFVKQYADLRALAIDAVRRYTDDVRHERFPAEQHTYTMPGEELRLFEQALSAHPV